MRICEGRLGIVSGTNLSEEAHLILPTIGLQLEALLKFHAASDRSRKTTNCEATIMSYL